MEDPCGIKERCQGRQEKELCEGGPVRARAVVDDGVEKDVQLQEGSVQVINAEQGGMWDWISMKKEARDRGIGPDGGELETGSSGQGIVRGVVRDERVRQ